MVSTTAIRIINLKNSRLHPMPQRACCNLTRELLETCVYRARFSSFYILNLQEANKFQETARWCVISQIKANA